MKVGIVVPYSWSFWGAVVEHAELQADALQRLGVETRTIIGHDPPGRFTSALHPRHGRHGRPPADVLPVGRSVIVPANGTLPNIVLSPSSVRRIKQALERERFDVLHLHEPMTPAICTAVLALARTPMVATFHASGNLAWMRIARRTWGFLADAVGRRKAFAISFAVSAATVVYLFPFPHTYGQFLAVIPIAGFGLYGALSGILVYGPELYPPSVRATGIALYNGIGRYITACGPLVAGVIAASWFGGDLGLATTCVVAVGMLGALGLLFAPETRGEALPTDPAVEIPPADSTTTGTITEEARA